MKRIVSVLLIFLFIQNTYAAGYTGSVSGVVAPAAVSGVTTPLTVNQVPAGKLSGWDNRLRIDIDYTNGIGSAVTHFPVTLFFESGNGNTTDIFSEIGDNNLKIAYTKADGKTELYCDIEYWSDALDSAVVHVSKSDWTISSDTSIFVYYDSTHADNSTYVGVTTSAAAKNVWDDNFVMVQHMADSTTSKIADATQYGNTGAKNGVNEPIEAIGQVGMAQSFDGSDDYIDCGANAGTNTSITLSFWAKFDTLGVNKELLFKRSLTGGNSNFDLSFSSALSRLILYSYDGTTANNRGSASNSITQTGVWYHIVAIYDKEAGGDPRARVSFYVDSLSKTVVTTDSYIENDYTTTTSMFIGKRGWNDLYFDGLMDEVRISNTIRSTAWIKAEYYSGVDSLLVY